MDGTLDFANDNWGRILNSNNATQTIFCIEYTAISIYLAKLLLKTIPLQPSAVFNPILFLEQVKKKGDFKCSKIQNKLKKENNSTVQGY